MNNKIIKNIFTTLLFTTSFFLPGLSYADILNKGFEYIYSLSKNDFTVAQVNRKLAITNNKLTYTSYTYPVGFVSLFISDTINEQSTIHVVNNSILSQSYSYVKKADKIKKQFHIQFDWKNNVAIDSRVTTPFQLTENSFDTLSFQLALAKSIKTRQPDLSFTLIDNKHIKTYKLESLGKEQLETDAGTFSTRKLAYFDPVKKRKVIIWCAMELDYLPVQVKRIDTDGDYATLKLISLKIQPKAEQDESENDF